MKSKEEIIKEITTKEKNLIDNGYSAYKICNK